MPIKSADSSSKPSAPGSRYGTYFYWVNYDTAPQEYTSTLLSDFDHRRPKYIILRANNSKALLEISKARFFPSAPTPRKLLPRLGRNRQLSPEALHSRNNDQRQQRISAAG